LDKYSRDIAKNLLQINAIKLSPQNPFTWASGMRSPIYCDNRLTLSFPDLRNLIAEAFVSQLESMDCEIDAIGGVATAGIPHGVLVAEKMNKPFFYVRSKPKAHGRKNLIEGLLQKGSKVVLIEDLISTGMSSLMAVEVVRQQGSDVQCVMSIFNYGFQKAIHAFETKKCTFASLCNYDLLLEEALAINYIQADHFEMLKKWKSDPEGWMTNN